MQKVNKIKYAKNVREWFAFHGGEELGISLEHASIVWDAAFKSIGDNIRGTVCQWTYDDDTCSYDTDCGEKWQFNEGTAKDNGVVFCHHCGRRAFIRESKREA